MSLIYFLPGILLAQRVVLRRAMTTVNLVRRWRPVRSNKWLGISLLYPGKEWAFRRLPDPVTIFVLLGFGVMLCNLSETENLQFDFWRCSFGTLGEITDNGLEILETAIGELDLLVRHNEVRHDFGVFE